MNKLLTKEQAQKILSDYFTKRWLLRIWKDENLSAETDFENRNITYAIADVIYDEVDKVITYINNVHAIDLSEWNENEDDYYFSDFIETIFNIAGQDIEKEEL